jgi:hypothetical protein
MEIVAPDLRTVVGKVALAEGSGGADPLAGVQAMARRAGFDLPTPGRYPVRLVRDGGTLEEFAILVEEPA